MCHNVPKGCSVPLTRGSQAGSATRATGLCWINPAGNRGGQKKIKNKIKNGISAVEAVLVSPGEGLWSAKPWDIVVIRLWGHC